MKQRRGVPLELVLVALLAALIGIEFGRYLSQPVHEGPALVSETSLRTLSSRFGPAKFSQGPEEWVIRDVFGTMRGGVFLDVGAYDPVRWSNTYFLEHEQGWSGIAIDAIEEFGDSYRTARPRSRFVVAFVGERDTGSRGLFINWDEMAVSSSDPAFVARFASKTPTERLVRERTLDSILAEQGIGAVDFVSMDIELGEPAALRGFSLARFRPRLLCIEAHEQTRQQILDHMARAGYVVLGRYLPVDPVNLYFAPLPASETP